MSILRPLRLLIATILIGSGMLAAASSDAPADDQVGPAKPATPAEVQAAITQAIRHDPGCWSDYDLDGDGKVSQVEVIACLARRPAWMREHLPELFKRIDTNHDNDISLAELQAFAALADSKDFTLAERPRSVMGASQAGGGAQAGAGINLSGGGVEASAEFMHQQAYIAGYQVVGGQYQPVIGVLGYGTVLTVGNVIITIVHAQR